MIRLLLDENLSESLARQLVGVYHEVLHVRTLGHGGASDLTVWDLAMQHDAILVSRDEDFRALSVKYGPPPKVVWLNVGNPRSAVVAQMLRGARSRIERLAADDVDTFLVLTLDTAAANERAFG